MQGRSFFMAGATSNKWCSNSELYDIYIDLVNKEIRISPHATGNITVAPLFYNNLSHHFRQLNGA